MNKTRPGNAVLKRLMAVFVSGILAVIFVNNVMADESFSHGESMLISSMVFTESTAATTNIMLTESHTSETSEYRERWFTANKFHQYLGLGSMALATFAAIAPKPSAEDPEDGIHHTLAKSAAYVGGAAVASGLAFHYKDLTWKGFFKNPDNLHALLGTLGTIGYFAALADAPDSAHATYGIAGAVSMLAAIKITW